ncbi:MAG: sulfite exporter TauE/SafE family protein [Pirellulaceae bacterium]|nr:sulfite exporter TauE/SafE family protein [Planctomycetales bacterium]MCA9225931.1 sulfite exporter TauE/SafE family protein [Planctomycetales bacterium]
MIEFPLILLAGLLGSSHCLGMCGGFALAIGSTSRSWTANLNRQLFYTAGRLFTYGTLGATAGFCGWRVARLVPTFINLPALLAILAGAFLVYQGLQSIGWLGKKKVTSNGPCLAGSIFATFLNAPGGGNAFLAGMFTGLLPCGLLYGMLALAASTRSIALGLALMVVFGVGTAPVMILTGCGGSLLSWTGRRRLFQIAAWCVLITGLLSIARGLGYVSMPGVVEGGGCPMCHT